MEGVLVEVGIAIGGAEEHQEAVGEVVLVDRLHRHEWRHAVAARLLDADNVDVFRLIARAGASDVQ